MSYSKSSLEDCAEATHRIVQSLQSDHGSEVDFFFFGHSDFPEKRSLVEQRKTLGWFNGQVTKTYRYTFLG